MLVAVIILAWLLVNTWLALILAQLKHTFFEGWGDLGWLIVYAIFNPLLALGIAKIIYIIIKFLKNFSKTP